MTATKGYSYLYGTSEGKPSDRIHFAYARRFNPKTLMKHYYRHGEEVGASSAADYEGMAITLQTMLTMFSMIVMSMNMAVLISSAMRQVNSSSSAMMEPLLLISSPRVEMLIGKMNGGGITLNHKCPCCGLGFVESAYDVCLVCGWENDPIQNESPDLPGGANRSSLNNHRIDFQKKRLLDPNYEWCNTWH